MTTSERLSLYTPERLAEILGTNPPTAEQRDVITAGMNPLLVVAGAGSGKTATMADRVVWLVAQELTEPEGVLGVTFTRKAAGELSERLRQRLALLHDRTEGEIGGADLGLGPAVSTYHAFAQTIVRDHGMRIGIEPDAELLDAAGQWMLATRVVNSYDGDMSEYEQAKSSLVEAVLNYASQAAEHLVDPEFTTDWIADRVASIAELPAGKTARAKKPSELVGKLKAKQIVAELAARYQELKRERSVLDFGDLIQHAVTLARFPDIARAYRERFPVVLLDEFQDTSHAQMELFRLLFGEHQHCITAVGDPNQSIYSFRGASAGQLQAFREVFGSVDAAGKLEAVPMAELTIAWRNDHAVLSAANLLSAPLRSRGRSDVSEPSAPAEHEPDHGLKRPPIVQRPRPNQLSVSGLSPQPEAEDGRVHLSTFATDVEEAEALALFLKEQRDHHRQRTGSWPTVAVLTRVKAGRDLIAEALREQGIPSEVVGLGGLVETPEVQDVIATLRVINDPGRSDALMRLLAGARWRIGPADLMALNDYAEFRAKRRAYALQNQTRADFESPDGTSEADRGHATDTGEAVETSSLVEALDYLPKPGWTSREGRVLSSAARDRLSTLRDELRHLRSLNGEELPVLLTQIEQTLGLDIELLAVPGQDQNSARRHLDAFGDLVSTFAASQETPDLTAFLEWLDVASDREGGMAQSPEPATDGTVQLLTVHASKGLEWDIVAIPSLVHGKFPSDRIASWIMELGELPWPLRGDAADLPQFTLLDEPGSQVEHQGQVTALHKKTKTNDAGEPADRELHYMDEVLEHAEREERRLAYVAVTRARQTVWCSAVRFSGIRKNPHDTSTFFDEVVEYALDDSVAQRGTLTVDRVLTDEETALEENPAATQTTEAVWPYDPLEGPVITRGDHVYPAPAQGRRAVVEAAADHVRAAMEQKSVPDVNEAWNEAGFQTVEGQAWAREAHLLLLERQVAAEPHHGHPTHVRASLLVETAQDSEAARLNLVRPIPHRPGIAAQQGTAFHEWLEEHFLQASGIGPDDELVPDEDVFSDAHGTKTLQQLKTSFLDSEWAQRIPYQVEAPVETAIAGVSVRGFIDAVYQEPDGSWLLVDWKTGRVPSASELPHKARQLAVYRLAWSRLHDIALKDIKTAFYYVAHGRTVRPAEDDLATEEELERALGAVLNEPTQPL